MSEGFLVQVVLTLPMGPIEIGALWGDAEDEAGDNAPALEDR